MHRTCRGTLWWRGGDQKHDHFESFGNVDPVRLPVLGLRFINYELLVGLEADWSLGSNQECTKRPYPKERLLHITGVQVQSREGRGSWEGQIEGVEQKGRNGTSSGRRGPPRP